MKKLKSLLFFFILLFPLTIYAQCKECQNQDEDNWKLGVGVTLLSNKTYYPAYESPKPYEVNFRYQLNRHHILRASFPVDIKAKGMNPPTPYASTLNDLSFDEYYNAIKNDYSLYLEQWAEYKRKLYGWSLGYDYQYTVLNSLSLFAGLDLSYLYQYNVQKLRILQFDKDEDDNDNRELVGLTEINSDADTYLYQIQPFIGIRYQFKKLLIEGSIGYLYSICYNKYNNNSAINDIVFANNREIQNINYFQSTSRKLGQYYYNISFFYLF